MSESKHTPGPWVEGGTRNVEGIDPETIEIRADNAIVALVTTWHYEGLSNARLIAAAPELLEAARELIHWLDTDPNDSRGTGSNDRLRAAIARAEGRE